MKAMLFSHVYFSMFASAMLQFYHVLKELTITVMSDYVWFPLNLEKSDPY